MLSQKIIKWYHQKKRNLPWRNTKNAYFIWLSEIILQQTRVNQGLPYYQKFIDLFPKLEDLANAEQTTVLRAWQGLGYYSRARNMHEAAQYINNELKGQFPENYNSLLKLKGVGKYTAAAISSIAYNEPRAVVDGNVYRVLSRIFQIDTPINSTAGIKQFENLAQTLIDPKQPGDYNQGIMELGATICKPKNPSCDECPILLDCGSYRNKSQYSYPTKLKKIKVRTRFFNYLILIKGHKTYLVQRKEKDIWQGLFEFFLIETNSPVNDFQELESYLPTWLPKKINIGLPEFQTQILTHQKIKSTFWPIVLNEFPLNQKRHFYSNQELEKHPKHKLVEKYLLDNCE